MLDRGHWLHGGQVISGNLRMPESGLCEDGRGYDYEVCRRWCEVWSPRHTVMFSQRYNWRNCIVINVGPTQVSAFP